MCATAPGTARWGSSTMTRAASRRSGAAYEVSGFAQDPAERLSAARAQRPFRDVTDLCHRAGLDRRHQALLAESGALKGLSGHRHRARARWAVAGVEAPLPMFDGIPQTAEPNIAIPLPTLGEDVAADYASIGLTLGRHPLSLTRKQLAARRCLSSADLAKLPHGRRVRFAGLVRMRQPPDSHWRDLRDAGRRTPHDQCRCVAADGRGAAA